MNKGEHKGKCNRTVCTNQGDSISYFNHSTLKYYCKSCAMLINNANAGDSIRIYGHNLCTLDLDGVNK